MVTATEYNHALDQLAEELDSAASFSAIERALCGYFRGIGQDNVAESVEYAIGTACAPAREREADVLEALER